LHRRDEPDELDPGEQGIERNRFMTTATETDNVPATTIRDILLTVIENDNALVGYSTEDLPQAAKARIQNTLCSLERHLTHEELDILEKWTGGNGVFDAAEAKFHDGGQCYYVYSDGSLYFSSNAASEVWGDARDFAVERIIHGYDGQLDKMDSALLRHLGGHYAGEIESRANV
jgi:hypothetical protein